MRVLLVEPDKSVSNAVELFLNSRRMNVYTTDRGEDAIDLAKIYDYDIVLLEINLPDQSGYDVIRTLRKNKIDTPILVVSGLHKTEDRVMALDFGADDYLTKPFHKDELISRIDSIVRRANGHADPVIKVGNMEVNLNRNTCEIDGNPIHLTAKEYGMLEIMAIRRGTCITKEMFLNHLYGGMDEPELKIIDVFICKLRKKLSTANHHPEHRGKHYIETIWGRGYRLNEKLPAPDQKKTRINGAPTLSEVEAKREAELLRDQMSQFKAELGISADAPLEETIKHLQRFKNQAEGLLADAAEAGEAKRPDTVRDQFDGSSVKTMPGFENGIRLPVGMIFPITSLIQIDTNEGEAANLSSGDTIRITPIVGTILELMAYGQGHKFKNTDLMNYIFEDNRPQNRTKLAMYISQAQGALTQLVGRPLASSILQVFSGGTYGMPDTATQLEARPQMLRLAHEHP